MKENRIMRSVAAVGVVAAVISLSGCFHESRKEVIDVNDNTGWAVIDAKLDEKKLCSRWDQQTKVPKRQCEAFFTFRTRTDDAVDLELTRTVTRKTYDRYDEGDWVRLRCYGPDPCEERP